TIVGRWGFSLTVTDSTLPFHISRTLNASITTIGVPPALPNVQPYGTLTDATLGVPFSNGMFAASGGTAPFAWSGTGVPGGLWIRTGEGRTSPFITAGDGEMTGSPTALGPYTVELTATDSSSPA